MLLLAGARGASLWRWRTAAPRPISRTAAPDSTTTARFSADGSTVALVDAHGRARAVGVRRFRPHPPAAAGEAITRVLPSPRGARMMTVEGRTASVRSAATGAIVSLLAGHEGAIESEAFSPDGRLVATGGTDGTARVWDATRGTQLIELRGHGATVTDVAFSPDGRLLLTDGEDGARLLAGMGVVVDDERAGLDLREHGTGWVCRPVKPPGS